MNDKETDLYMRGYAKGLLNGLMIASGVLGLSMVISLIHLAEELLKQGAQ